MIIWFLRTENFQQRTTPEIEPFPNGKCTCPHGTTPSEFLNNRPSFAISMHINVGEKAKLSKYVIFQDFLWIVVLTDKNLSDFDCDRMITNGTNDVNSSSLVLQ